MNWQSYEKLVKDIYEQLGKSAGVRVECWGPLCKVEGKSCVRHQIDVLTAHSDGIHEYKTAIECKHWNKRVDKDPIAKLAMILEDARIEKGVVVSRVGFTKDAEQLARSTNVSLVRLREPRESDWDGRIKQMSIDLNLIFDEMFDYQAILCNVAENQQTNFRNSGIELRVEIEDRDGMSLREIAEEILKVPKSNNRDIYKTGDSLTSTSYEHDDAISYALEFPDGTVVTHPKTGKKGNIRELRFKVRQMVCTEKIYIDCKDYVSWIMEVIFEDKIFAISRDRTPSRWE